MNIYYKTVIVSTIGAVVSVLSGKVLDKYFPDKKINRKSIKNEHGERNVTVSTDIKAI